MIHTFLKSIGFSELYQNKELYQLAGDIIRNPDERAMDQDTCGNEIACFTKYVENDMGICVCGSFLEENQFQMEYYFPFFADPISQPWNQQKLNAMPPANPFLESVMN